MGQKVSNYFAKHVVTVVKNLLDCNVKSCWSKKKKFSKMYNSIKIFFIKASIWLTGLQFALR